MTSNSHRNAPSNAGGYHDAESKSLPVRWRFLSFDHELDDCKDEQAHLSKSNKHLDMLTESSDGTDNREEANTSLGSSTSELRSRGLGAGGVASGSSLGSRVGSSGVLAGVRGVGVNGRGSGGAVDGGGRLGRGLLGLRGLGGLDNGGGVGRDGQGGGLGDRVGLVLVGDDSRSGAHEGGLLDNLGGGDRVLDVLGARRSDRVGGGRRDGVALGVDRSRSLVLGRGRGSGVLGVGSGGRDGVSVVGNRASLVDGSRGSVGRGSGLVDGSRGGLNRVDGSSGGGANDSSNSEGTHFDCEGLVLSTLVLSTGVGGR
jgi:hypothetical protein